MSQADVSHQPPRCPFVEKSAVKVVAINLSAHQVLLKRPRLPGLASGETLINVRHRDLEQAAGLEHADPLAEHVLRDAVREVLKAVACVYFFYRAILKPLPVQRQRVGFPAAFAVDVRVAGNLAASRGDVEFERGCDGFGMLCPPHVFIHRHCVECRVGFMHIFLMRRAVSVLFCQRFDHCSFPANPTAPACSSDDPMICAAIAD